jgi:protein-disulfide isomerase
MKTFRRLAILTLSTIFITGCSSDKDLKDQMARILLANPKIITEAIEKNPAEFITALQNAAKNAQESMGKKREEEERLQLEESFNKPLMADLSNDVASIGPSNAPITLVEYSDFECPFCLRGNDTVKGLMTKYPGKIRFIYKHLPLSFHEQAMISAQYFEAIRKQSNEKAFQFHDEIFKNQSKLKNGKAFLDSVAKNLGIDMNKLKIDVSSESVKNKIGSDVAEAAKFGMQGTPGFLLNGIPVRGAYPVDYFVNLIDELQKRGKLKL